MDTGGKFISLKGEFEAEGLSREEVAVEALFAKSRGLRQLIKIGGCEARSDMNYLVRMGISGVVAPMIESPFAMEKYMSIVPDGHFHEVGVTIETANAVRQVDDILAAGDKLTHVTIGRTDLTASFRGSGVDSPETLAMVKQVSEAGRRRGLQVTMGGSVSAKTRALLRENPELAAAIECVETRKIVIPVQRFLEDGVLEEAIEIELALLELHSGPLASAAARATDRIAQLRSRL